jgi:hypothetical protein
LKVPIRGSTAITPSKKKDTPEIFFGAQEKAKRENGAERGRFLHVHPGATADSAAGRSDKNGAA